MFFTEKTYLHYMLMSLLKNYYKHKQLTSEVSTDASSNKALSPRWVLNPCNSETDKCK